MKDDSGHSPPAGEVQTDTTSKSVGSADNSLTADEEEDSDEDEL